MHEIPSIRFPRVAVDVSPDLADESSFELFEWGATGVELRDDKTLDQPEVEGKVTLLASFPTENQANEAIKNLNPSWNPRRDDVVGDDWRDGWKEHFRPFLLTPSILITPPWCKEKRHDVHVIEMDPGRAFGTGLHATTRLVAQAIERHGVDGLEVLDVGCGSGVLAFCALVLGAKSVRAVDNDPEAVSATIENAQRNGLAERVIADTTDVTAIDETFPFVVANIESKTLIGMAEALKRRVKPDGILVLSGILKDQAEEVLQSFQPFTCIHTAEDKGWIGLELQARK